MDTSWVQLPLKYSNRVLGCAIPFFRAKLPLLVTIYTSYNIRLLTLLYDRTFTER